MTLLEGPKTPKRKLLENPKEETPGELQNPKGETPGKPQRGNFWKTPKRRLLESSKAPKRRLPGGPTDASKGGSQTHITGILGGALVCHSQSPPHSQQMKGPGRATGAVLSLLIPDGPCCCHSHDLGLQFIQNLLFRGPILFIFHCRSPSSFIGAPSNPGLGTRTPLPQSQISEPCIPSFSHSPCPGLTGNEHKAQLV